ncbi:hypothetical protein MCOR29_006443 [Pyricularia oryzae]|nr:hypothetical protein MCOR19_003099 [Pyricularia oryzae]KAI6288376.1 hypothetical protein MCOR34_010848 [Pyricularia oryzae]KAI6317166.1 hypothetical protein MCOR29_006443 [Pyricularia oryzae]KAI6379884.1 hypothetical protein MCOR32_004294 [Pyricularia oryzae]KAI6406370.1 hypothetical protein MCOR23_002211 [Pyricularia oryzae]
MLPQRGHDKQRAPAQRRPIVLRLRAREGRRVPDFARAKMAAIELKNGFSVSRNQPFDNS